jgi:quercetin dioxygenase-like cupin family protein
MSRKSAFCCGVLALILIVSAAFAQGIKRTVLEKVEFPDHYTTITAIAEVDPGMTAARHTHPGLESAYVLEGEGDLQVEGQPERRVKAGDYFEIPAGTPHEMRNVSSTKPLKVLSTYIIERGKPLATPAPK